MAQEETSPAGGAPAPWDPEQWWSFGEAADRAGVTHQTLRDWAEKGEVMVRMAWREGTEFRLVRAGDVARLAPGAVGPGDRSAPLEDRALYTGPRRSALGAGAPVAPREPGGGRPNVYEDDRDAFRRTAEMEIERLRTELDRLRSRGPAAAASASPAPMDLWSIEEPRRTPHLGVGGRGRPGAVTLFACGLVLGVITGALLGPSGAAPPRTDASAMDMAGGEGGAAEGPAVASVGSRPDGPGERPRPEAAAAVRSSENTAAAPSPAGESKAGERGSGASSEVSTPEALSPARRLPLGLEEIGALPHKSLDGQLTCEYGIGELGTATVRLSLGGCWGALAPGGEAVLATDRVQGVACCKHHAAVERLKGVASSPRARSVAEEEAAQAIRDGLVPPMLELRAERSAVPLARALTGGWRASSFDGPVLGRTHRWAFTEPQESPEEGGASLEFLGWVERGEDGAFATYRMVLELGDSAAEDRAVEFQWLE